MPTKDPTERMVLNAASTEWRVVPDVMVSVIHMNTSQEHVSAARTWDLVQDLVDEGLLEQRESVGSRDKREVRLTATGVSRRDMLNRGEQGTTPDGTTLHFVPQPA